MLMILIDTAASALIADSCFLLSSDIDGINGLVAGASEHDENFDWKGRHGMGTERHCAEIDPERTVESEAEGTDIADGAACLSGH